MELARELRNNLHPTPQHTAPTVTAHSPGSRGRPPDSSVMALFTASATNTRQLLPLLCPTLGFGVTSPQDLPSKQTFFTSCSRCKTVTSSLSPSPFRVSPVFQRRLLSPASLSHLSSLLPLLDPVSASLQDDGG